MLPFDLRVRRVLQYRLDENLEGKATEREKLKKQLVDTFKSALTYYEKDILGSKDNSIWWGTWLTQEKAKARGGYLKISRVSSDAFFFNLFIYDGPRTGEVSGKAQILTPHSAYARLRSEYHGDCEIVFRRRLENDSWWIEIEESQSYDCYHGLSATFSGVYKHENETMVNWGYLDEIDLNEIERITGKYLPAFLDNSQQISTDQNEFGNEMVIVSAALKGMYNIRESIVVLDQFGKVGVHVWILIMKILQLDFLQMWLNIICQRLSWNG